MRPFILCLLGLVLGFTGCVGGRSPQARFFQLQPPVDAAVAQKRLPSGITVSVKPVILESYLRQPQMAVRVKPQEVVYREFTRWAEPLDRNITRVVTDDLRKLFQTDRIAILPQIDDRSEMITLSIEVISFEAQPDGQVRLKATWLAGYGVASRTGSLDTFAKPASGDESDIVEAQSKLLAVLSLKIADQISALANAPKGTGE